MSAVLTIDWNGPARQACPSCKKPGRDDAVSVTMRPEGGVAHCHRCRSSWYEKPLDNNPKAKKRLDQSAQSFSGATRQKLAQKADVSEHKARQALKLAREIWAASNRVDDEGEYPDIVGKHPYLRRKQCRAHGVRVDSRGGLVVPMLVDGELVNLQRIVPDGTKRFLAGGRTRGAVFVLDDLSIDVGAVFIAEGFATSSTVHEATGLPCIVAFSAGNLLAAAAAARRMHPGDAITIAADNDAKGERNPGLEAARAAARELRCSLTWPSEPGDWNDARVAGGWGAVVAPLNKAAAMAREAACRT